MTGKMSMIKIAVLGEGGVGKTSLTIQVRVIREGQPHLSHNHGYISVSLTTPSR